MAAKKGIKIVVKRGTTVDGRAEYFFAAAEQRRVTIGTDGDLCHVVFSAAAFAMIGEEHLELARDAGHYELCLNNRDKVLVDGEPAMDKQEILSTVEIQVGDDGPVLEVTPDSTHSERKASFAVGIPEVMKRQRLSRRVTNIGLAAALLAITVAVYFSFQRDDGKLQELADSIAETRKNIALAEIPEAVIRKAIDATYLVVARDKAGGESGVGTAWVTSSGHVVAE